MCKKARLGSTDLWHRERDWQEEIGNFDVDRLLANRPPDGKGTEAPSLEAVVASF